MVASWSHRPAATAALTAAILLATAAAASAHVAPINAGAATANARDLAAPPITTAVTFTGPPALVARAEQWQSKSLIPLGTETVELHPIAGFCPGGYAEGACSQYPQYGGGTAAVNRGDFYFDIGHQLDWSTLTDANRRYFARKEGEPHWPWWDSILSLDATSEDGLEGSFGQVVEQCAFGHPDLNTAEASYSVAGDPMPTIDPGNWDACKWITHVVETEPSDQQLVLPQ